MAFFLPPAIDPLDALAPAGPDGRDRGTTAGAPLSARRRPARVQPATAAGSGPTAALPATPAIRLSLGMRLAATGAFAALWTAVGLCLACLFNAWLRDPPEVELLRSYIEVRQAELALAAGVAGPLGMACLVALWARDARRRVIGVATCLTGAIVIFTQTAGCAIPAAFSGDQAYLVSALWCSAGAAIAGVWLAARYRVSSGPEPGVA